MMISLPVRTTDAFYIALITATWPVIEFCAVGWSRHRHWHGEFRQVKPPPHDPES
jgi:hypothetical protein